MFTESVNSDSKQAGAYARPTLRIYGDVTVLTASGTGTLSENGNQPNCATASNKKPC